MFGRDALNLLVTQLQQATAGSVPAANIGVGWVQEPTLLQNVAGAKGIYVSVYDTGKAQDASRFMLYVANDNVVQAGIVSSLSQPSLLGTNSVTVTLSGTIVLNDAVSFVASNGNAINAAIAEAGAGATPTSMATALAAAINAQSTLNQWVTAGSAGSVVTVTGITPALLQFASNVGNIGTRYTETHREARMVQVDLWAPTDVARTAVGRLIDQQLSYLDAHFGVQGVGGSTDDGTWVRIRHLGDQFVDTNVLQDLYRWMWRVSLEYGQTYTETLYSVLAWLPTLTPP